MKKTKKQIAREREQKISKRQGNQIIMGFDTGAIKDLSLIKRGFFNKKKGAGVVPTERAWKVREEVYNR